MKTIAEVIRVDGELAQVKTMRTSACEGCHKNADGKGCSVCTLMGADREMIAKAYNRAGARVGDRVYIESSTRRMIGYAGLVFLLPLLLALLGWGIASMITATEWIRAVSALGGFVLALSVAILYSRFVGQNRCDIEITEILQNEDSVEAP